jgi:hypothetical protein
LPARERVEQPIFKAAAGPAVRSLSPTDENSGEGCYGSMALKSLQNEAVESEFETIESEQVDF